MSVASLFRHLITGTWGLRRKNTDISPWRALLILCIASARLWRSAAPVLCSYQQPRTTTLSRTQTTYDVEKVFFFPWWIITVDQEEEGILPDRQPERKIRLREQQQHCVQHRPSIELVGETLFVYRGCCNYFTSNTSSRATTTQVS